MNGSIIKAYCNTQVTDEQLAGASVEFYNPQPQRKLTCIVLYFINITRKPIVEWIPRWQEMKIRVEGLNSTLVQQLVV
jgi:hypothetical protein